MTSYDFKHLLTRLDGDLLHVTMNRPERFNALNDTMVDELSTLFAQLYWRSDVRVVLLSGAGKNFCAGLDLKERKGGLATTEQALVAQRRISQIVIAMRRCPQPVISLVQGAASGGGFALALASDLRVLADDARMNAAFIRVGLGGCDIGSSYFLPRMVGVSVASEYLLTGNFIDAQRAYELGLANRIVTSVELAEEAMALARSMQNATPLGLRLTKEALNHAIDAAGLEAVIALEDRNQVLCSQSDDFAEGIAAFMEKRAPRFAR